MATKIGISDLEPIILTLERLKKKDLAIEILETFAKISRSYAEYDNIAKCFFKLKEYSSAIEYGLKTLILAPDSQRLYYARENLINVYQHANYPEIALKYIEQNEHVIPNNVDNLLAKAYSYYLLTRRDEAEEILQNLLSNFELSEEVRTKVKFNLGTYYLYKDEFQKGLRLFLEEGAKMKVWNTESIFARNNNLNLETFNNKLKAQSFKKWDGIPRPGAAIIVHAEAGIGDEIINFRFIKRLTDLGMIPYWYNSYPERSDILKVFERQGFNVIRKLSEVSDTDVYYTQSMHLPIDLNLEYKDLWYGPYITADKNYIEKWSYIKNSPKLKIGIRWQGNPFYDNDLHRSVDLKGFYESLKHLDADFYSLQKDNGLEELEDFPGLIDLGDQLNSWEDTLAVIENLDLVITSCTSVAHASAAMGKKTCIFVPISAYYVWSHSMEQSPWYGDNVKLFRQETPRTWKEPLKKLNKSLFNII